MMLESPASLENWIAGGSLNVWLDSEHEAEKRGVLYCPTELEPRSYHYTDSRS